jgi:anti-anti-sigma regulatory factor
MGDLPMSKIAEIYKIDAGHAAQSIRAAREKLAGDEVEAVLDFVSVQRIDPDALRELEELANLTDMRGDKVWLLHVNVEIYKVLKLAKLSARFNFRN